MAGAEVNNLMWSRSPQRVHRVLPGQVIVAASAEQTLTLEGLAAAIWIVLDRPGSGPELLDRIAEDGPGIEVRAEVLAQALDVMEQGGLLRSTDSERTAAGEPACP